MDVKALREEFGTLHTETGRVLTLKSTEKREYTAEEKEQQDKRYARMDLIQGQIQEQARFAKLALDAGTALPPAEPNGRAQYEASEGRLTFRDASGTFNLAAFRTALTHYSRTGDARQLYTVTTGSQSGVFLPTEVLQPVTVRRLQNAWRGVLAAGGMKPMTVDSPASFSIPVADDTANVGQVLSEAATGGTSLDPALTGSMKIAPTLWDSKQFWYSNTVINSGTFDAVDYTLPMAQKRIDKIQESTWTTNVMTNGVVGITTAGATAMTYAELLTWEHSLAAAYRTDACFVLSDSLYKVLRGLVDNNLRPIMDLDPTNVFAGKIHNKPVVISDYFQTMAANHVCGAFVSSDAIKVVDVNDAQLIRYSNYPPQPGQVGFQMLQNGDFGFVSNGLSLVKSAIS